jgi:hypothetical protein
VAATLTRDQEDLVHFSFPIEKQEDTKAINPVDNTPDIWIWGKATDGTVDGDKEIVDPEWSAKALQQWADTGGNVRMSHDPKRPVGKGHQVQVTTDGHYVKSLICDPLAKHFIRQKVLNDYSVGISSPDFRYGDRRLDPEGKALRIITGKPDGSSRVVELSVVDRGSNFNSSFQIVKSAGGEFTGEMVGDEDEIAKAAPAALLTKAASDTVSVDLPKDVSVSFTPTDLKKLLDHRQVAEDREAAALKAVMDAERPVWKRDIDTATRRRLASQGRALDNLSYPIETHEDADNAVTLALSGHGNVAAAKKLIRRIASKEGWQDILDRLDGKTSDSADKADGGKCGTCHGSGKIMDGNRDCPDCDGPAKDDAGKEVTPDLAKDDGEDEETDEGGSQSGGGALHHDDGQDDDTDSDADAMDKAAVASLCAKYGWTPEQFQALPEQALAALVAAEKAASPDMTKPPKMPCPSCKKPNKAKAKFCAKCGAAMTAEKASKPTPADHAEGAAESAIKPAPEHREPDGPVVEAFEHDAGLPTVPDAGAMPMKVAAFHKAIGVPHTEGWLHDLTCPAFDPATAKAAHPLADLGMLDELAWQAKALDTAARAPLDQAREAALLWQHALTVKTTPPDVAGEILAEAHKAFRDANPGPGRAPVPGEIPASRFHRPYITDGHAAPSPGQDPPHRDPVHAGHVSASMYQRGPLESGHAEDSPGNANPRHEPIGAPEVPGVPSRVYYSRMQRDNARQAMTAMHDHIARTFPDVCPMHGPGRMGEPGAGTRPVPAGVGGPVPHGASKASDGGDTTFTAQGGAAADETAPITRITPKQLRRRLEKAVFAGEMTLDEAHAKLGIQPSAPEPAALKVATAPLVAAIDPEVIKAAVTEAIGPALAQRDAEHADELEKVRKELKGLRKVADAIADQPDPNVTAYRGVALMGPPATKTVAPAGGAMADRAERAQQTLFNAMYEQWRTASSPEDREIAFDAMKDMTGLRFTG